MRDYSKDFSRTTVKALKAKGIQIVSATYVPGPGGDFANGETGYVLVNDGMQMIRTYREVIALSK